MKLPQGSPATGPRELLEEADLLRRLRAGEERAFEPLVRTRGGRGCRRRRRDLTVSNGRG